MRYHVNYTKNEEYPWGIFDTEQNRFIGHFKLRIDACMYATNLENSREN